MGRDPYNIGRAKRAFRPHVKAGSSIEVSKKKAQLGVTGGRLVSVVLIFFDAGDFICEAIESVFAQTYGNWELLLVDDGSTDASLGIPQRTWCCSIAPWRRDAYDRGEK